MSFCRLAHTYFVLLVLFLAVYKILVAQLRLLPLLS